MKIARIRANLLQEWYITKHSLEIFFDLFVATIINVLLFSFIAKAFGFEESSSLTYLIMGVLLWEVIRINQYTLTLASLWNAWSHNLSNMFITPISLKEYFAAHLTSGAIKSLLIFLLNATIAFIFFDFNVFDIGLFYLLLIIINLLVFSWSVGFILLGLVFRFGLRMSALAWGVIFIFEPLAAAFFPVGALPLALRALAYCFPATYMFEAARNALTVPGIDWRYMGIAFLLNVLYASFAIWFFKLLFKKSKQAGQFARNDT